jgi:hypothetical protein
VPSILSNSLDPILKLLPSRFTLILLVMGSCLDGLEDLRFSLDDSCDSWENSGGSLHDTIKTLDESALEVLPEARVTSCNIPGVDSGVRRSRFTVERSRLDVIASSFEVLANQCVVLGSFGVVVCSCFVITFCLCLFRELFVCVGRTLVKACRRLVIAGCRVVSCNLLVVTSCLL